MLVLRPLAATVVAMLVFAAPALAANVVTDQGQIRFNGDSAANDATFRLASLGGSQMEITDAAGGLTESSDDCTKTGEVVTCTFNSELAPQPLWALGNGGNDTLTFDPSNGSVRTLLYGGAGTDTIQGGGLGDAITGDDDGDLLKGGGGADQILGGKGADTVDGEDGDDYIAEGNHDPGPDVGDSSDHGDVYRDTGATGKDILDWAYLSDGFKNHGVRVSVGDTDPDGENGGQEADDVQTGFEEIRGTSDADVIVGAAADESLIGEDGNDQLTGGGGADGFVGGLGADTLYARDERSDAKIHCFVTTAPPDQADVGGETAFVDAAPLDQDVAGCETVDRPTTNGGGGGGGGGGTTGGTTGGGGTSSPPPPPALTKAPAITGTLAAGSTLTCDPGTWTNAPTFTYSWQTGQPPKPAGEGATLLVTEAHEGSTLTCSVRATNTAGSVTARVLGVVPQVERMPNLLGKDYATSKRTLETTYGTVDFGSDREQDRRGKGIDQIPCAQGGLKGACDKARLQPGEIFAQSPKAGTVRTATGLGAPLMKVELGYYDASKDEAKPAAGSPKKYGDNCPLRGAYDDDRRDAWLDGLIGEEEKRAKDEVARVECDVVIKAVKNEATRDPYVLDTRVVGSGGKRRVELKVSRPRYQDLAIIVLHYRIRGSGVPGQRFDPGLGLDGQLTTHSQQDNQICFLVHEASTGRPVDGAEITGTDPTGTPVRGDGGRPLKLKTEQGLKCGFFRIVEQGTYTFDFRYAGANGMDEEGRVLIGATDRDRKPFTTWSGYNLEYGDGAWILARPKKAAVARIASVQDDLAKALAFILSPFVALGNAITGALDALSQPEKSVSFKVVGESPGPKPAVLAGDAKLKPSLSPPPVGKGATMVAAGGGNLIGLDGATMVAAGGGNMVAAGGMNGQKGAGMVAAGAGNLMGAKAGIISHDGASVIGHNGATVIGQNGATVISTDGAGLIGNASNTMVAAGAGNVIQLEGRSVIADQSNKLPAGTMVAAGAGNALPVAPMVAAGAGNR